MNTLTSVSPSLLTKSGWYGNLGYLPGKNQNCVRTCVRVRVRVRVNKVSAEVHHIDCKSLPVQCKTPGHRCQRHENITKLRVHITSLVTSVSFVDYLAFKKLHKWT